ncbi:MAG: FMN-binding glutamate synthase family protein, partial [Clostridia bacterium]|nr:FMN-binding glutamate synthase family protein [Clostridia bacterium]
MTFSLGINASEATRTTRRLKEDWCPFSGMCVTCLDGCVGYCEVGKSAVRGREYLYPQPFGQITAAAQKDYPVDFSHFNIMGSATGAYGIAPDSDAAVFPAVNLEAILGSSGDLKLRLPVVIPAMGSTNIAAKNWDHLAAGAALAGVGLSIGENVCAMDPRAEIKNGRVVRSPDLERRVEAFRRWYRGYGFVAVQANVEDTNLGVQEYAIEQLGVEAVELKWGQGAKNIGGEVKLDSLERALQLKSRGYIV